MKARQVFIALMTGKGYAESELEWDGEKFTNANMTTRWNYFLLGWEMRGVMPQEMRGVMPQEMRDVL